jgi:hypothetical protein
MASAEQPAPQYGKPLNVVDVGAEDAAMRVREWLDKLLATYEGEAPFALAVGGPRESEARGIYKKARDSKHDNHSTATPFSSPAVPPAAPAPVLKTSPYNCVSP